MHLIDIDAVACKLKRHRMLTLEKASYFIGMVLLLIARIGVFNLLPTLYFFTFNIIKQRLEFEARTANLTIDVPSSSPTWFIAAQLIIIAFGIFGCYAANRRGDNKQFIERFVCLSWPAMMRIMIISTLLFGFIMIVGGNMFFKELSTLAAVKPQKGFLLFRLFKKTIKQLNVLKTIGDNLVKLGRAKMIFAHVSQFSLHMYAFAHGLALFGTAWYFRSVRQRIGFLARLR